MSIPPCLRLVVRAGAESGIEAETRGFEGGGVERLRVRGMYREEMQQLSRRP